MQPNTMPKPTPQRGKGRKFFQQLQPTFALDLPSTSVKLQFLDENDPAKDTIVRKKAREWVNRNRNMNVPNRPKQSRSKETVKASDVEEETETNMQLQRRWSNSSAERLDPLQGIGKGISDPFNVLPDVGRKYDHIIDYFLTRCPEEIPCSDDKYADPSNASLVAFSSENTILGNMAKSEVTFVLWLYATITIRDGIFGCADTEEVRWFYNKALEMLQEQLRKDSEVGQYSETLLKALACITATASFAGMFKAAELHCDAMVRVLTLRGGGDMLKSLQMVSPWTAKALQWCEIMVATQRVETPRIPYYIPFKVVPLPAKVVREAERLQANTIANLPLISGTARHITLLLHKLGVAYDTRSNGVKIDPYILQPLYDAEYAILQHLESQKEAVSLTDVEILLVATYQLFFWTGARLLPPQTRLCDLLLSRIMKTLLPLLLEKVPDDVESCIVTARGYLPSHLAAEGWVPRTLHHGRPTNNVIAWSLALGTIVSSVLNRPEHAWFKGHFRLHMQSMKLDQNEAEYIKLLEIFPATQGFDWINLKTLWSMIQAWGTADVEQT
ncbi:hypothetical protein FB567DRAFT_40404 [Paraphoma chrysanthemicola]|uniref:Uncharacterized protein n=1 Tax=Paraphoma chrysanthemicola TaxID=798071 RepID=A0A8K0RM00_9PLEO|nr:hypothetical protein FB567DRAFT_40404 [Paraphoma chrysanthemicola]